MMTRPPHAPRSEPPVPEARSGTDRPTRPQAIPRPKRKPYRPPRLTVYGDVRDLTLGPSPGIGESGAPSIFRAGVGAANDPFGR